MIVLEMPDHRKLRFRNTLRRALRGFPLPIIAVLLLDRSASAIEVAVIAGLVYLFVAAPLMTFLFAEMVPFTRRYPFLPAMAIQAFSFLAASLLFIYVFLIANVSVSGGLPPYSLETQSLVWQILSQGAMKTAYLIGVPIFVFSVLAQQIRRKLGPGVMWNWVTGKYHRPREERRVFMFLDLKDSTPLAERLGPVEFSALVQDFFKDVGWAVEATNATVSHYIGDEAVIVWPVEKAFKDLNCIRLFFRTKKEVDDRTDYYKKRYGVVPSFKAGVHIGEVVSAEVGLEKSEIVYHGDAVNTTARIVGQCSALGCDLLVSADVAAKISGPDYRLTSFGAQPLKGKSEAVEIFGVYEVTPQT